MEGDLFNQSISLFHFPILPSFCPVLCTVSFTPWALSAAVALNYISLVDLCPFIPHNFRYPLPSFVLHCFPQWFFLCITYLLLIFSNNSSCGFSPCSSLISDLSSVVEREFFFHLSCLFGLMLALMFKTFAVMLQSAVLSFSVSCPTRSILFTLLKPAGCWICCSSWYLTIARTRTKNRNTTTLQTSHYRHWMRMLRCCLRNWTIFQDTSPGTRSFYPFFCNLQSDGCC